MFSSGCKYKNLANEELHDLSVSASAQDLGDTTMLAESCPSRLGHSKSTTTLNKTQTQYYKTRCGTYIVQALRTNNNQLQRSHNYLWKYEDTLQCESQLYPPIRVCCAYGSPSSKTKHRKLRFKRDFDHYTQTQNVERWGKTQEQIKLV